MIIWRCDRCGFELNARPIVGNEFAYKGFKSLATKIDGKQDFCDTCFSMIEAAAKEFYKKQNKSIWDVIKKVIS